MTPQFEHDCDKCQFLGPYMDYDLYYCPQDPVGETLVARFGDDGPDYLSMPPSLCAPCERFPALSMALRRAMEIGLIAREE